tara:strand:- start:92 stop:271 length:180 start_codon:yes stop_codon:yes gene_type:complete
MIAKVIQFISSVDQVEYEIIVDAMKLYDEYLHSQKDIPRAIKVRKMLSELKQLRNERQL